jgi:DNA-directed RNA polymerase subunit RPC12/RpoP
MISEKQVSAKCRRCGKTAPSNSFVLDPDYKLMVCPQCIKEKREAQRVRQEVEKHKTEKQEQPKTDKPAGWDSEDEYLERQSKRKEETKISAERIDSTKVKYTCQSCKYAFVYDTEKRHPKACPYCNAQVLPFTPR